MHFSIDYDLALRYTGLIFAHSGRVLEPYLNAERGVASCGGGLEPSTREARDPVGRHYDLAARRSLHGPGTNAGEGSAGPEPKIATVERREASVPRMGTRGASLGAWPAASRAGPRMPRKHPYVSRRSATPKFGRAKRQKQNPGAKNAPRERRGVARRALRCAAVVERAV